MEHKIYILSLARSKRFLRPTEAEAVNAIHGLGEVNVSHDEEGLLQSIVSVVALMNGSITIESLRGGTYLTTETLGF